MNIIFLDYDGVVNTPIWNKETGKCRFNFPSDGRVNNEQAIMWLNELWRKTGQTAAIVVSSTWRYACRQDENSYQDCLYNAGLDPHIKIIGCTDFIDFGYTTRTEEIKSYIEKYKDEIDNYVILDDEFVDLDNFVQCNSNYGFGLEEFVKAKNILLGD